MSLLTNLESYWKLDEASGNATDAHGTNTLTNNNSVGSGTGKLNGCRTFARASSQRLSIADNSSIGLGDVDFTFTAWVKFDSLTGEQAWIGKWSGYGCQKTHSTQFNSSCGTARIR